MEYSKISLILLNKLTELLVLNGDLHEPLPFDIETGHYLLLVQILEGLRECKLHFFKPLGF